RPLLVDAVDELDELVERLLAAGLFHVDGHAGVLHAGVLTAPRPPRQATEPGPPLPRHATGPRWRTPKPPPPRRSRSNQRPRGRRSTGRRQGGSAATSRGRMPAALRRRCARAPTAGARPT